MGFNLIEYAGVAGLDRLPTLTAYIGYMRYRLFFLMYRLKLVQVRLTRSRMNTWLPLCIVYLFGRVWLGVVHQSPSLV